MSDQEFQLWVNTLFRGRQLAEFLAVKKHLGIQSNTDVIRHLIHKQARVLLRRRGPPQPLAVQPAESATPAPPVQQEPEADARRAGQTCALSEVKALCFSCSLPDCDETNPRCLYRRVAGRRAEEDLRE